ncbi:MAG: lysine 2,3-aminomutase, partial [Acidobacteriota bacterium]
MHRHLAVLHEEPEIKAPVSGPSGNLCAALEDFLNRCGHSSVLGTELATLLDREDTSSESRLLRLLTACGYPGDAPGFFAELSSILESGLTDWRSVKVNGIAMPHALLLTVLEAMEPGDGLIDVTSVDQLEKLLRRPVPACDRISIQEVLDRFPVRLSQHALRQLRLSGAVGRQYLPFVDELSREGLVHTWVGQFHSGVIERMYRNRVIMVLNMTCPVYCRFCFRKHKECRQEPPPTRADVIRGVDYVRSSPEVTEVVLTGGDPFMNRSTLTCAVEGLLEVGHVQTLRLATRSLSYHPALFTQRDRFWMSYLENAAVEADRRGKRIEIATHFIHPDELSLRNLDLIA